jgi:hypothetical protein
MPRPIKGSGYSGKRFFKLREILRLQQTPKSQTAALIYDNPSTANDWASFASLFDSYRCCAVKLRYTPYMNVQDLNDSIASNANVQVPLYVYHDMNTIVTTTPSYDDVIQYENLRVKRSLSTWTYYTKMRRNIPINTSLSTQVSIGSRGYIPCNTPVSAQTVVIYFPSFGSGNSNVNTSHLLITYYCIGKEAR